MNRHERRKAAATGNPYVDDYVSHLPEITKGEAAGASGLIHAVVRHDDWCRVLKEGGGLGNCNCNPTVSYHAEPHRQ